MTVVMTEARLLEFATAWGKHDLETLMELFTDDCVYKASVGAEPGATYVGKAAVRAGVLEMFAVDDGSTSEITRMHVFGDVGFWEWTYRFPDGRVVFGCDLFEFVGDRIRVKNAFRKTV
jgi:ketosteroid isomerase-like protein